MTLRDRKAWLVRPARPQDRDAVAVLIASADALHAKLQPRFFARDGSLTEAKRRADSRTRASTPNQALLVAELDGDICGLAEVHLYDAPRTGGVVQARRALIEYLVVDASHRRGGCGRALVDASRAWAKARGAEQLMLTLWAGNRAAARFYRACGFGEVSRVLGIDL